MYKIPNNVSYLNMNLHGGLQKFIKLFFVKNITLGPVCASSTKHQDKIWLRKPWDVQSGKIDYNKINTSYHTHTNTLVFSRKKRTRRSLFFTVPCAKSICISQIISLHKMYINWNASTAETLVEALCCALFCRAQQDLDVLF